MLNKELVAYIQTERAKGVDDKALFAEMILRGWTKEDSLNALSGIPYKEKTSFQGFTLRNLLSGRINRAQYLICMVSIPMLYLLLIACFAFAKKIMHEDAYTDSLFVLIGVMVVTIFLYWVSVFVRRLHDLGYSGKYALLIFVPIVGNFVAPLLIIYLLLKSGQPMVNLYGEPPTADRPLVNVLLNTI